MPDSVVVRLADSGGATFAGVGAGGALKIDGSGVTQPISGAVSVTGTVSMSGAAKLFRDSAATVQAAGSATGPTAGTAITTVAITATGLWEITVGLFLFGTVAVAETNNVQLRQNATARLSPILVPGLINVFPAPTTVVLSCTATDTVSVNAIANATVTASYAATITARQVG